MEVRIEAGDGMHLAHVHGASIGYGLKLLRGQIPELPLNRFQVLKYTVGIVSRRTRLLQRSTRNRHRGDLGPA